MIYGHISFMTNLLGNFLLEFPFIRGVYPNVLYRGNYTLWILSALSMIVILYRGVEYFKDSICLKPFAIIGRNTMTLYVCHWPLLLVVRMVADTFHLTPIHTLILMSLTCVVFLPFCQYCIKRSIGR